MTSFLERKTWLGIGGKVGGTLFVVGMEDTTGLIFNIGNPNIRAGFSLTSVRLGPGLGGGAGLTAICVFNCDNIWRLHNTQTTDWGVNLSLGEKWDSVVKALKNMKFFAKIARIGPKLKGFKPSDIESLRNDLHYLYNAYDIASSGGDPKVICLDTPASIGLEVSLNYTIGTIEIL